MSDHVIMTEPARVPPGPPPRPSRRLPARRDVLAVVGAAVLVTAAVVVGHQFTREQLNLNFPPLLADQEFHVGPGTPFALCIGIAGVVYGHRFSGHRRWSWLLWLGYLVALAWTVSLALIDGYRQGWAGRLETSNEYLSDLPTVGAIGSFVRGFTSHILDFQPGSFTTHVSSHPPLATLVFVVIDRVGLHGGGWAGLVVMMVGSSAGIAVAVTLRALGAPVAARRALPALVLFPGAVWVGVSADGLFTGVVAWGIALTVLGASRAGRARAALAGAGGLLLGATVYLSYGLALMVFVVAAAWWLSISRAPDRPAAVRAWWCAAIGIAAVVLGFTFAGFNWLQGVRLVSERYYQGVAAARPYGYFVWADLAAFSLSAGLVVAAGLLRAIPTVVTGVLAAGPARRRPIPTIGDSAATGTRLKSAARRADFAAAALPVAAFLGILAADLTGLSKAETERIWLPFGIWMVASLALLPPRSARWALAAQVVLALSINHLLKTYS